MDSTGTSFEPSVLCWVSKMTKDDNTKTDWLINLFALLVQAFVCNVKGDPEQEVTFETWKAHDYAKRFCHLEGAPDEQKALHLP